MYIFIMYKVYTKINIAECNAAGPTSLDYFQKGALFGLKRHKIFGTSIPGQIRKKCSRAFEDLSFWFIKFKKELYL